MSRPLPQISVRPCIALVDRANRALQADMVRTANEGGFTEIKNAHNAVFGTLPESGGRTADMAARAGITRQSMGEIVRDLASLGLIEMTTDPTDGRAKLVTWTDYGRSAAHHGYQHILDLEARFAREFGAEEYAVVRDVLGRVIGLLEPPPET